MNVAKNLIDGVGIIPNLEMWKLRPRDAKQASFDDKTDQGQSLAVIRPFGSYPHLLFCLLVISISIRVHCDNGNSYNDKIEAHSSEVICPKSQVVVLKLRFGCSKFSGGSDGKECACNAGDPGLIPGLGRSHGEGNGNPLQSSYLENSHGERRLASYSPWGCKLLNTTERLSLSLWTTISVCLLFSLFPKQVFPLLSKSNLPNPWLSTSWFQCRARLRTTDVNKFVHHKF